MTKNTTGGSPQDGEHTPRRNQKKPNPGTRANAVGAEAAKPENIDVETVDNDLADAEAVAAAVSADQAKAEQEIADNIADATEHLDELALALAEVDEYRDRYLRLKAEWDNFRKRTEIERAEERSRAAEKLVKKILPVLDDMERAIEHSDSAQEEPLKEGVMQVYAKLQGVLESEGVELIDPKGEPFDANKHYAISKAEDRNLPDEIVLEVFQKGYALGGRVLRPASVIINCR